MPTFTCLAISGVIANCRGRLSLQQWQSPGSDVAVGRGVEPFAPLSGITAWVGFCGIDTARAGALGWLASTPSLHI